MKNHQLKMEEPQLEIINIVLFYCNLRTGHYGQGTFINSVVPFLKSAIGVKLTIINTDCTETQCVRQFDDDGIDVVLIPRLVGNSLIECYDLPVQQAYAGEIIRLIYPFLVNKSNLLFWINSIDYLNVAKELKSGFPKSKLLYVHHAFSWKYLINVPDDVFAAEWKRGNDAYHPRAFMLTSYQQRLATISDLVVAVTHHARNFLTDILEIPSNKITTIYNGRPLVGENEHSKMDLRVKYGFAEVHKIILFSGRVTDDKGFHYLAKAFKLMADKDENVRLVILGSGDVFKYTNLLSPHWNKVTYTGELDSLSVSEFYSLADIGIMPSLHEQCSFTVIEMRLHNLPMIVTAVDGLDEMFTDDVDSVKIQVNLNKEGHRVLNERQMAKCMTGLLRDNSLKNRLATASFKKGSEQFSLKKMQENYYSAILKMFR